MKCSRWSLLLAAFLLLSPMVSSNVAAQLGIFEDQRDIGSILHPGAARFDPASRTYTVSGSGDNMWFGADDLHFVWKKASGDMVFSADIKFMGTKGNNHRKAALLLRQTLEPNSMYADVAVHGDGLTSLQYRDAPGATTHEVEAAVSAPQRVRIVKQGSYAYVFTGGPSGSPSFSGAAMRLDLTGDFYVGLGVCAHDKNVTETAVFSNVTLEPLPPASGEPVLWSTLETVKIASTDRLVAYTAAGRLEAPSWSSDGASILFNRDGVTQRFTLGSSQPPVPAAGQVPAKGGQGVSPDGKWKVYFAGKQGVAADPLGDQEVELHLASVADSTVKTLAKLLRAKGMDPVASWSPDSTRVAFVSYARVAP